MPLQIVRNDITKMEVDAIVNATDTRLSGDGGVDAAIHCAAGPALRQACNALGGCREGEARLTTAGALPCKYVIHTVGPRWLDGEHGEEERLACCYSSALMLAKEHGCRSIAIPLISSGVYGYPKDQALRVAVDTISRFLFEHDMAVSLVVFDRAAYRISTKLFEDIAEYIDDNYSRERSERDALRRRRNKVGRRDRMICLAGPCREPESSEEGFLPCAPMEEDFEAPSLEEMLSRIDESFSEMLLRKIDESGMTDAQCYKKANIDRKLFSKIRSDRMYKPSKATVLAFAIALELPLEETRDMLMKAGFALSRASKFDIIIEYFIRRKNYDIFEINAALFAFDQALLGA